MMKNPNSLEKALREHLNVIANQYYELTGWTPSHIGAHALGDATFFRRLNQGAGFTVATYDRLIKWSVKQWPDGYRFPKLKLEKPK